MSNDNKIAGTYQVLPAAGYAGDVAPATAWKILSERKDAVLIDVRTRAEWNYVGLPDLEKLAKKPALIEWQVFPSMQANPEFVAALSGALPDKEAPLLFLCRSGARSAAAANLKRVSSDQAASAGWMPTTAGSPAVSVPVLSNTTTSAFASSSR